uniref:Alpha-1,3-mannosyl-glycoprotein 4-beta-N-acetylglucosaminyltransferase C n=1 Tax=Talaromyces marneffei PM1 TaxID=1077442 RepID=A0A093VD39_TALMA
MTLALPSLRSKVMRPSPTLPRLCIGMPTARRSQEQYVDITIASLFAQLTPQERAQILFNLLIAHTNPDEHPFYDGSASTVNASRLADNVLFYHDIAGGSKAMTNTIRQLEEKGKFHEKSYYDYDLLLHQCAASMAPYILILEDDVLAQEGCYTGSRRSAFSSFPTVLIVSILVVVALPTLISPEPGPEEPPHAISSIHLDLDFLQPLRPGIHVMNNYGCCSQAFVFRRTMALKLLDWFDERIAADIKSTDPNNENGRKYLRGSVDSAMEVFANEQNLQRYALVPSAFQHIGAQTYKESKNSRARELYNISGARGIWSFGFEQLVPPA